MTNIDLKYETDSIKHILIAYKIAIYGAGTMGKAVFKCLSESPYNKPVSCFIVKSIEDNPNAIEGVPVFDIAHATDYKNACVLIALNGKYMPEVVNDLTNAGFTDLVPISFDGDEWTALRGNWIVNNAILPKDVKYLSDLAKHNDSSAGVDNIFHIYVVHSAFDRTLSEQPVEKPYELAIQVGAALTEKELFDIRDNFGQDNISEKNRQYCELTGVYWAWKNDTADYVGFSHYRRKFVLTDEQLGAIISENIDVCVTEPLVNFATVRGQYAKNHILEDWDNFMHVIGELAPEYMAAAKEVQDGIYYFAYNMFIMRREIFDEYCSFVFPILSRCEQLIGSKEDTYQNRYVGFLAERLLSIFITHNAGYRVAIADKHFIE